MAKMDLDKQITVLIENAPQDGVTPKVVEAIAPVLKLLASQLQHLEYYILQSVDQRWVLFTLSNRTQPQFEKNVIYAFPTLKDAINSQSVADPDVMAVSLPVTHLLFQLAAMETVHSIVFFETPGNLSSGTEVPREDVQNLIQERLQLPSSSQSNPPNLPPDIA